MSRYSVCVKIWRFKKGTKQSAAALIIIFGSKKNVNNKKNIFSISHCGSLLVNKTLKTHQCQWNKNKMVQSLNTTRRPLTQHILRKCKGALDSRHTLPPKSITVQTSEGETVRPTMPPQIWPGILNELWKRRWDDPHLEPRRDRQAEDRQEARDGRGAAGVGVVSLDDLEVVQDRHDVLRHEEVAGVHGHAGHRDEQRVWGGVKEETDARTRIQLKHTSSLVQVPSFHQVYWKSVLGS